MLFAVELSTYVLKKRIPYFGNWMAQQSPLKLLGVLLAVRRLAVGGVFQTEVTDTYPLDQAATALAASLEPGRTGKVMLRIGSR